MSGLRRNPSRLSYRWDDNFHGINSHWKITAGVETAEERSNYKERQWSWHPRRGRSVFLADLKVSPTIATAVIAIVPMTLTT